MWTQALQKMKQNNTSIYGPRSFLEYCATNDIKTSGRTPNYISIDYYEKLHKELKENNCMVLRLGSENMRKGTNFVLIKDDRLRDFFLFDDEIFVTDPIEYEMSLKARHALSIMKIFEKPSEMMLVSYLLSSGVLGEVLGLDEADAYYTPLTGRNSFTFSFRPGANYEELIHQNGQVEIDAVFTGARNGKPVIVVVEAKNDTGRYKSLSKHKLYYAYKSVQSVCEKDFEVIPVYLKLSVNDGYLKAMIAECEDRDDTLMGLSVVNERTVVIKI